MLKTDTHLSKLREDFPILHQKVNGYPLVYLDNAATSQKPRIVIDALRDYYQSTNANIHRGAHYLAHKATEAYELTRNCAKDFLNAGAIEEIIFTKGTTEAINLIASTYGRQNIHEGDEIIISAMEHHANIVPWQIVCAEKKASLKVIPLTSQYELDIAAYKSLLNTKTKIVALCHASNTLGTINDIKKITELAHKHGAICIVDGAQGAVHLPVDVKDIDCDFYAFSAHKIYGPTGIGILYGKKNILESMPPYQGGGEMIKEVSFETTSYNELPYKFEAGTPNIADVIAFKYSLDWVSRIGKENIAAHEHQLLAYATEQLKKIKDLIIVGNAPEKVSVISFNIQGLHHHDIGTLLDQQGIAVRTGHHCTQPLMKYLGISGTVRVSFALYNTMEEIDLFIKALHKVIKMLKG